MRQTMSRRRALAGFGFSDITFEDRHNFINVWEVEASNYGVKQDEKAPHYPNGYDHLPDLVGAGLVGLAFLGGLGPASEVQDELDGKEDLHE